MTEDARIAHLKRRVIHYNFVISGLDEASTEVLELLAGLYKQISAGRREPDRNPFSCVPRPNVQARVP